MEIKYLNKSMADNIELSSPQEDQKTNKLEDLVGKIVDLHNPDADNTKSALKPTEDSSKSAETKDESDLTPTENMQENEPSEIDHEKEK